MKIVYKNGDILNETKHTHVAFAISGDYSLGAGLAKKINEKDRVSDVLNNMYPTACFDHLGQALRVDPYFCLVIKNHYRNEAYADDILDCLTDLAEQCEELGLDEIAMPKICTGHEGFDWECIEELIQEAFDETDITVVVYNFEKDELNNSTFCDDEDFDDGFIDDIADPVTDSRKCFLYNVLLSHLEEIYDEETLYETLLSLGFTHEEIAYEGLVPDDCDCCDCDDDDCDCGCNCHCHDEDEEDVVLCGGIQPVTHECRCQSKPTEPTETETKETCCGGKYIDEEECEDCDGCSCDGNCQGHTCEHNN